MQLQDLRLHNKWSLVAAARRKNVDTSAQGDSSENEVVKKRTTRTPKRTTQTRKQKENESENEKSELEITSDVSDDESMLSASAEDTKKTPRRTRKKGINLVSSFLCNFVHMLFLSANSKFNKF